MPIRNAVSGDSRKMEEELGEALRGAGFLKYHWTGLGLWSRDGVYYQFSDVGERDEDDDYRDIRLVVIGPMTMTPAEYSTLINGYWVKSIGVMQAHKSMPPHLSVLMWERGMWTITLRSWEAEERPSPEGVGDVDTSGQLVVYDGGKR